MHGRHPSISFESTKSDTSLQEGCAWVGRARARAVRPRATAITPGTGEDTGGAGRRRRSAESQEVNHTISCNMYGLSRHSHHSPCVPRAAALPRDGRWWASLRPRARWPARARWARSTPSPQVAGCACPPAVAGGRRGRGGRRYARPPHAARREEYGLPLGSPTRAAAGAAAAAARAAGRLK